MRTPRSLVLRSGALATTIFATTFGTMFAHAGESHAGETSGRWAAVGWYGVAAVVAVVVVLGLFTRHRPDAPIAVPDNGEQSGGRGIEQFG